MPTTWFRRRRCTIGRILPASWVNLKIPILNRCPVLLSDILLIVLKELQLVPPTRMLRCRRLLKTRVMIRWYDEALAILRVIGTMSHPLPNLVTCLIWWVVLQTTRFLPVRCPVALKLTLSSVLANKTIPPPTPTPALPPKPMDGSLCLNCKGL